MKRSCDATSNAINPQSGMALVFFTLLAPLLIGLVALAADLGSLYLARDRLNSLARTGAAAGMNLRALKGWANLACDSSNRDEEYGLKYSTCQDLGSPSLQTQQVLAAMEQAINASIRRFYPNESPSDISRYLRFRSGISPDWQSTISRDALDLYSANEAVRLQVKYAPRTLLVSRMPSIFGSNFCSHPTDASGEVQSDRCEVVSESTDSAGYLRPANIFLLLDTSGSMAQSLSGLTKIEALKRAVGNFIDNFNPRRDQITLVPFSTGAPQSVPAPAPFAPQDASYPDRLPLKQQVVAMSALGQTNPCDALIKTIQALPTPAPFQAAPASFAVLFTDGAPNVYRLGFCDNSGGCTQRPETPNMNALNNLPSNDWYGWTVKWGQRQTVVTPTATPNTDPLADPVFGLPQIVRDTTPHGGLQQTAWSGSNINTLGNLVIDQTGRFRLRASDNRWYTLNQVPDTSSPPGPFKLAFQTLSLAQDNYLWNGPSYLVHANYPIRQQNALIDRILRSPNDPTPITCGPPTGTGADQFSYNHSRYFASRVLDSTWSLGASQSRTGLQYLMSSSSFPVLAAGRTPLIPHLLTFPGLLDTSGQSTPTMPYPILPLPTTSPGCLNTLNSFVPGTPAEIHVRGGSAQDAFISNRQATTIESRGEIVKSAELPYYCAIRAADYLRERGVILFVIGLGPAASDRYTSLCTDPLQNALDFDTRKDIFLRRLAFAPESLANPANFIASGSDSWAPNHSFRFNENLSISGCSNHPLEGIAVRMGYSDDQFTETSGLQTGSLPGGAPGVASSEQLGAYYPSTDPSELTPLFGKIAKQILLRLSM